MLGFPRSFGKYTLLATLGRGGMGEVYAARVASLMGIEKLCVIKTVVEHANVDREAVGRFLDEARLAVRLNQRNICSVFDVGIVDGVHYLAMDMVRGRDLKTIFSALTKRERRLDVGLAIHIITEVLDGLAYAHRLTDPLTGPLHIVHRDVSPQNVMVSFEGDVKLIDFGLAASTLKLEKTEPHVVMGKIAYMPPEQITGQVLDARADVFSTGVTLYELLSGERYYEEVPPLMISSVAARGGHRPGRWDELDAPMKKILGNALAADRDQRTASAAAFGDQLRDYVTSRGLRADPSVLRALMLDLFSAQAELWETSDSFSLPPHQPTQTQVVADGPTRKAVDELTAGTERLAPRPSSPSSSRTPFIAAAALVATAIVVATVVSVNAKTTASAQPDGNPDGNPALVDAGVVIAPPQQAPPPVVAPAPPRLPIEPLPHDKPKVSEKKKPPVLKPMDAAKYAKERCPELACAKMLATKKWNLTKADELTAFEAEAQKCYRRCWPR